MLILSVVTSSRAYGGVNQWTTNGPPFAANHVVVDPSLPGVVYTEAGRTADGGLTWQRNNLSGLLESVAAGPSGTVYVGTGIDSFGLLFKSLDAGVTWGSIPFANSVTETFFLRVDPTVPSTVYAATATKPFPNGAVQYSVRKSTDGASTWSSCGGDFFLRTLAIDPLNASTLYAGGSKSTDGCATWRPLPNFPPDPYAIAIDPAKPATVYAANFSGIFKSTDGGESFAAISAGLTNLFVTALVIDPKNPNRLYAGTQGGGVFASTSAGVSWKVMNDGLTDLRIRALAIDPSGRFLHASATSAVFDLEVVADPGVLTLYPNRSFSVTLSATDQRTGRIGPGVATSINALFGYFSIPAITHDPDNPEVFVKILDGRGVNGRFWFFYGGLTDLEYTLTMTEDATARTKTYIKPAGSACGGFDTEAFEP